MQTGSLLLKWGMLPEGKGRGMGNGGGPGKHTVGYVKELVARIIIERSEPRACAGSLRSVYRDLRMRERVIKRHLSLLVKVNFATKHATERTGNLDHI